jgi:DNA-binding MarR family transcriptional regulator
VALVEDLSAAFVAFSIEVDDAAEARIRHRTTRGGDGRDPSKGTWLVSLAMWRNCMQWLPAEGTTVAELVAMARTPTDFGGMRRWGYVGTEGTDGTKGSGAPRSASGRPRPEAVVRPTRRGARAQQVWDGLPAEVEQRWADRFGSESRSRIAALRATLVALAERLDPGLPDTMPIVRHGWATRRDDEPERRPGPVPIADLGLDSLLARPLTAFALEYEASGKLSLALQANLLAVLGPLPTPLRDLPDATGIHRAQIDNAAGYLERAGLAEVVPTENAKGKSIALTARGRKARSAGARKIATLEAAWDERHGEVLSRVRTALAPIAMGGGPDSPLLAGLEHPPGTWRAEARPLARLPRFPLVTHRGGFPDGA